MTSCNGGGLLNLEERAEMKGNQQEKILQLEENQKSMSSEIERLESMIMDMKNRRGSKDDNDEASGDFMTMQKTLEEFEALNQTFFSKQCHAYGKLNQTLQKLRHHGGKEKLDERVVELEIMMNMFRDENVELKRKLDEMTANLEEKEGELKDLESFNQTLMVMERKSNNEIQEARQGLVSGLKQLPCCVSIGIKRMGELDPAPFTAAVRKRNCTRLGSRNTGLELGAGWNERVESGKLCSLWEKQLRNPNWHPFRMVRVGDQDQEIIDEADPKLKGLKNELGEDAYKAVTTSLMEMNQYNPSGRYPVSEIWNSTEGRKASLKEAIGSMFLKLKSLVESVGSGSVAGNQSDQCKIPAAVFHDFAAGKSHERFQPGQIWAVYCDLDSLPKFYALIDRVELDPKFELHIKWLDSCHLPVAMIKWVDMDMPICIGAFKLQDKTMVYTDNTCFSHQLCMKPIVEEDKYEIYPGKGEVWALYKNFDSKWTCSDMEQCEYDIVEVLGGNAFMRRIMMLEQVSGYKTVFKPKSKAGGNLTMGITQVNFLRFSHQVPAFQLTEEKEGFLRGYWELDPNSIPACLLSSD